MRNKQQIINQHEDIGDKKISADKKAVLRSALELEVQIDIRDAIVDLTRAVDSIKTFMKCGF